MKSAQQVLLLLFLLSRAIRTRAEEVVENYYNEFSVCSDSIIVVDEISLLCDSPGTYYYGSGKYRNSAKCQAGDKARVQIEFYVAEELEQPAYLSLYVEGYGSVQNVQLHSSEDVCALEGLQSANGYSNCPNGQSLEVGYYYFKETFNWGSQNDAYEYSFRPKVVVGLASGQNMNQFDLGGANTNKCAGNTLLKWTTGVGKTASNTLKTFFLTFGILIGAIVAILFAVFFIMKKAKKTSRQSNKVGVLNEELIEENNETNKIAMMGQNRDLVNF